MGRKVIVITGATASGKTALGIETANRLNGEVISADSRQVFKYFDIGTAKPTLEELSKVKHHFIGNIEPEVVYNAGRFEVEALEVIDSLFIANKQPVVVGGSGLYIRALIEGIIDIEAEDESYREELESLRLSKGNEALYQLLLDLDPDAAATMLPQNYKRVVRALEVFKCTGESIIAIHKQYKRESKNEFISFYLDLPRELMYKRIEDRIDKMLELGLLNEIKELISKGYDETLNSMNTVGYKEFFPYLRGEYSLERAIELLKRNTRRYAKRQVTWFKGMPNLIPIDGTRGIEYGVEQILKEIK